MAAPSDPSANAPFPLAVIEAYYAGVQLAQTPAAAAMALVTWDWIVSADKEYRRIWRQGSWTIVKILYVISRYWTLGALAFLTYMWYAHMEQSRCASIYRWTPGVMSVTQLVSELILLIRVYALYDRNMIIGGSLGALLVGEAVLTTYVAEAGMEPLPLLPGVKGPCFPQTGPHGNIAIAYWIAPMVFDAIVTALSLFKAVQIINNGTRTPIIKIIIREGLIFFVVITLINATNVILFLQGDESIRPVAAPLTFALTSALSCRLILALRSPASFKHRDPTMNSLGWGVHPDSHDDGSNTTRDRKAPANGTFRLRSAAALAEEGNPVSRVEFNGKGTYEPEKEMRRTNSEELDMGIAMDHMGRKNVRVNVERTIVVD